MRLIISLPHGKKIPPGECCTSARMNLGPVINPLSEIKSGEKKKVVYVSTKSHASLNRFSAIGVISGLELIIHQKHPSIIIQYGETQLVLDKDIAEKIFVRGSIKSQLILLPINFFSIYLS